MRDFERCSVTVHVLGALRPGLREGGEIWLIHDGEDHQMAARDLRRVLDHFRECGRLSEIGDPNHQTPAMLAAKQDAGCARMIRLGSLSANLGKTIHNGAKMPSATADGYF